MNAANAKASSKPTRKPSPAKSTKRTPTDGKAQDKVLSLQEHYRQEVVPGLIKAFAYRNVMQVPTLQKVTVSMGLGEAINNPKVIESATTDLTKICGQRPRVHRARRSVASFKLREGMPIGISVTLRKQRMWNFLERLIHTALPRVRDFRGLPRRSFDGRGNYALGLQEQIIFPEINYDAIDGIRGMNIVIVNSAQTDAEGFELLQKLGVPFRRRSTDS